MLYELLHFEKAFKTDENDRPVHDKIKEIDANIDPTVKSSLNILYKK